MLDLDERYGMTLKEALGHAEWSRKTLEINTAAFKRLAAEIYALQLQLRLPEEPGGVDWKQRASDESKLRGEMFEACMRARREREAARFAVKQLIGFYRIEYKAADNRGELPDREFNLAEIEAAKILKGETECKQSKLKRPS